MRYLLFPFRWADAKVQNAVDRGAFRLMDHLRCERRVLVLMLSLVTLASLVSIVVSVLAREGSFLTKAGLTLFLCYGGWNALTLHMQTGNDSERWRFYVLTRFAVACMKLMIVVGILLWSMSGAPYADLTAPTAASLLLGALAILCGTYLQRTPLSRPQEKAEETNPAPTSAPADL